MPKSAPMPSPGWSTDAVLLPLTWREDGDTVKVVVWRELSIRINDCWAPETKTRDTKEKKLGKVAQEQLVRILKQHAKRMQLSCDGYPVRVMIEADPSHNVGRSTSMGRFVGRIWTPDGVELAAELVRSGHAAATKAGLERMLVAAGVKGRFKRRGR